MAEVEPVDFNDSSLDDSYNEITDIDKQINDSQNNPDKVQNLKEKANNIRKSIIKEACKKAKIPTDFVDSLNMEGGFDLTDQQTISNDPTLRENFNKFVESFKKSGRTSLEKIGIDSSIKNNASISELMDAIREGNVTPEQIENAKESFKDILKEKFKSLGIKELAILSGIALALYIIIEAGGPCSLLGQITSEAYSGCFYTSQATGKTEVLPPINNCDPTTCCNGCNNDVASKCNNCCNASVYPKVDGKLVQSGDIFQYRCKGVLSTAMDAVKDIGNEINNLTDPSKLLKFFETIGIGLAIIVGIIIVYMILKYILSYMQENLEEREMARKTLEREE